MPDAPIVDYRAGVAATSAGILLYRGVAETREVLLVHPGGPFWARKDEGAWSIPKGEVGEDEELQASGLRELEEELGTRPAIAAEQLIDLGTVRQKAGKLVHCWAAEADFDPATLRSNTFKIEWPPRSGQQREFPEVDRAEWFDLGAARVKINPAQIDFLDRLQADRNQGGSNGGV
jgi:predicted NUDIX family NTP pyrophosphohydrolase